MFKNQQKDMDKIVNGYEQQIQLLQKQVRTKNIKILQITRNRQQMLKQQISSCFQSIEKYLKLIGQKVKDSNISQYISQYIQFSRTLYYKQNWFVNQKTTSSFAVQTEEITNIFQGQTSLKQTIKQRQQQIVSVFQFNSNQQFYPEKQNYNIYQAFQCKTEPHLREKLYIPQTQIEEIVQFEAKQNQLQQKSVTKKIILQNLELKQLLRNAQFQLELLEDKNKPQKQGKYYELNTSIMQNNLNNCKKQNDPLTHRIKLSQGNINYETYRNSIRQRQKNSELISSDIYNLSQTPLLSIQNKTKTLKIDKDHNQITKYLFNSSSEDQYSKSTRLQDLSMILVCQANSIQKLLLNLT